MADCMWRGKTLLDALFILAQVHTRDDDIIGFVVDASARPNDKGVETRDYIDAWQVVRQQLHQPSELRSSPQECDDD